MKILNYYGYIWLERKNKEKKYWKEINYFYVLFYFILFLK